MFWVDVRGQRDFRTMVLDIWELCDVLMGICSVYVVCDHECNNNGRFESNKIYIITFWATLILANTLSLKIINNFTKWKSNTILHVCMHEVRWPHVPLVDGHELG